MFSVWLMALSLAVDAFAVSVACGVTVPGFRLRDGVRLGCWFGAFQFLMPLLGSFLGDLVSARSQVAAGLLSFGLLAFLGGKLLWDGLSGTAAVGSADLRPRRLAALAVATSLDALAAGVSMPCLNVPVLEASAVIGGVAFCLSLAGGLAGRGLGTLCQRFAHLLGGSVLIAIGVKILLSALG